MQIGRRSFLTGLLAAPIIVRPGLVMPIRPVEEPLLTATEAIARMEQFTKEFMAAYEERRALLSAAFMSPCGSVIVGLIKDFKASPQYALASTPDFC